MQWSPFSYGFLSTTLSNEINLASPQLHQAFVFCFDWPVSDVHSSCTVEKTVDILSWHTVDKRSIHKIIHQYQIFQKIINWSMFLIYCRLHGNWSHMDQSPVIWFCCVFLFLFSWVKTLTYAISCPTFEFQYTWQINSLNPDIQLNSIIYIFFSYKVTTWRGLILLLLYITSLIRYLVGAQPTPRRFHTVHANNSLTQVTTRKCSTLV